MSDKHSVFIAVGSNLGDKLANCKKGIVNLEKSGKSTLTGHSQFYKTEPVDYKEQGWFINCMVKVETVLEPLELLDELKSIEHRAGRKVDSIRFGPRVLDLDIILYDDIILNTPRLVIPHYKMHKRRFVLKPICDIEPEIIHPVLNMNMRSLLDLLNYKNQDIFLI